MAIAVAVVAVVGLAAVGLAVHAMRFGPGVSSGRVPAGSAAVGPSLSTGPNSLHGRAVLLDPGHNGGNEQASTVIARKVDAGGVEKECDTVGAETNAGYPEHAFTFDVVSRAAVLLRGRGARVVLTRTDDSGVGPCINERARMGNDAHADAAVSVHADGGPSEGTGFHVIAPSLGPDGGDAAILAPSARLADAVRNAFQRSTAEPRADYIATDGLAFRADLGGLNLSRVPKVFIECANMRNAQDAVRVSDATWRQRAAQGIADGITSFLTAPPSAAATVRGGNAAREYPAGRWGRIWKRPAWHVRKTRVDDTGIEPVTSTVSTVRVSSRWLF
ncbi:N-acetylmuramoyl-L-alanine amidase [Frankia sp. Cppng1_Ct_nod]|uniref:N-acetylmuramoyl-L-alanine amidase n=1 Tax=Frankia sp. Cppng1_Ct_nod TaxID=2897162 RepID=UPI0032EA232A